MAFGKQGNTKKNILGKKGLEYFLMYSADIDTRTGASEMQPSWCSVSREIQKNYFGNIGLEFFLNVHCC